VSAARAAAVGSRPAGPQRAGALRRTAAVRWWMRSGMWFIAGACGGRCRLTSRPGARSMASTSGGTPTGPSSPCTTHYAARPAGPPGAPPSLPPRWSTHSRCGPLRTRAAGQPELGQRQEGHRP